MNRRITVNAIIRNERGEVLLCKMPSDRGVYPGQWAIPGGGIEESEKMREALARELREEVGLVVGDIVSFSFDDDERDKLMSDGSRQRLYMIHLVFDCRAVGTNVAINDEFDAYAWVMTSRLNEYDLNEATVKTFRQKGWI